VPWVLLDVALPLLALVALGAVLLRLWRRVKALGSRVSEASAAVGDVTARLDAAQAPRAYAERTPSEERL
jgi:hypothetical protein